MSLYQLSVDFERLYQMIDDVDPDEEGGLLTLDAVMDTLDGIECELNEKAENLAVYIKRLTNEAEALKKEETTLAARRKTKENKVDWLKTYLKEQLLAVDKKKLEMPRAVISIRNNPESVIVDDEQAVLSFGVANNHPFVKPQPPKLDKPILKRALQAGLRVSGAHLERSMSLQIK